MGHGGPSFKPDELVNEAVKTASEIASFSPIAVKAAKEVVNESFNLPLEQGIKYERRIFHTLWIPGSEGRYGSIC